MVQAETQEHLQVLAQAEQNGMAHHEVVGQFEKMALTRQDVTQQLKQRMDHFATRVRILEKEIAGHQDAEHAAFEQECQYWEGALRTARDRYEREMEDLETRYFAVCRQAHIVVPAEMILMKKKRKTDRVVLEGAEAQRIAETLQHTANKRQGVQQRLDHSDQEHSRVWQGKAVQRDLELGGQSISDLQRKVAEARVKSNMEQALARHEEFTGPQSLTTEAVSRANRIEQMAQDARAARDNAYAARVMRETQHNEEPHFSAKALANGNTGRESPMTLLLREHTQAHAQVRLLVTCVSSSESFWLLLLPTLQSMQSTPQPLSTFRFVSFRFVSFRFVSFRLFRFVFVFVLYYFPLILFTITFLLERLRNLVWMLKLLFKS